MKRKVAVLVSVVMTMSFGSTAFAGKKKPEPTSRYSFGKLSIVSMIKAEKAGGTVCVYEGELSKGKLPYYVLEELAKTDNITLSVVSDSGEKAEIRSSSIPEKGKNAFFTVDELLDMTK
ncbi:MAG: hypothetical protein VB119_11280 [Candidatus Metalachnospira sp.]|nr:hypothetical protein [Candidatus Metalachnospira sp.]